VLRLLLWRKEGSLWWEEVFVPGTSPVFRGGPCKGPAAMAGLQERPDCYLYSRRGGADLALVGVVHGPAGRDGDRAAFWQSGAHSRAGAAHQAALCARGQNDSRSASLSGMGIRTGFRPKGGSSSGWTPRPAGASLMRKIPGERSHGSGISVSPRSYHRFRSP
jgi:hypothetical protein